MKLVLLGQPGDAGADAATSMTPSLPTGVALIWCDAPEQVPWSTLGADDLVLLLEQPSPTVVEWRRELMSRGHSFQVIPTSDEPWMQALQWALGHHLQRTTGHSPWPLRAEIAQRWQGVCETCSDPECEHRLFRRLVNDRSSRAPE